MACARQARAFCAALTYQYGRFDTCLNLAVLAAVSACLAATYANGSVGLGELFWLPFVAFICALQLLSGIHLGTQGFSLIWCALCGVLIYEELRYHALADGGTPLRGLAALALVLVAVALVVYGVEELVPMPGARFTGRRSRSECLWARAGSTLLHSTTLLLSGVLALAADEWHGGFYLALGAAALSWFCAVPISLRCRRSSARVSPMSPEELAIAALQEQLLRARERLGALRASQLRRQRAGEEADEGETNEIRELELRERTLLSKIEAREAGLRVSERSSGGVATAPVSGRIGEIEPAVVP